jgi:hypothetical protein
MASGTQSSTFFSLLGFWTLSTYLSSYIASSSFGKQSTVKGEKQNKEKNSKGRAELIRNFRYIHSFYPIIPVIASQT